MITLSHVATRRALAMSFICTMMVGAGAASQIPYATDAVEAGKIIGDMDAAHLLGTITIASLALCAFLGYLLYRSQKDQWSLISALKEEIHEAISKSRGDK